MKLYRGGCANNDRNECSAGWKACSEDCKDFMERNRQKERVPGWMKREIDFEDDDRAGRRR